MTLTANLAAPVDNRDFMRGSVLAPVTIVEYADYQCPYSGQMYFVLKRLEADSPELFRLVYRNFPLVQIRPQSLPAALAAEAAGVRGKFWEMHDILFENQDSLEPEHLLLYAQVLGLDVERFIVDLTSDITAANVREDFISGLRSGVNGTPTLYINGVRYDGVDDYEPVRDAVHAAAKTRTHNVAKAKQIIGRGQTGTRL